MPTQHMLTLHMFVRSPHTSPWRNGQRLQRWDDEHDGTITINTTDEEDSISQSSCFCVFQCMSHCLTCVPYARPRTQQGTFFSTESGVNQTRYGICMHRTKRYSARSDLSFKVYPRPPAGCDYFLLAVIGNSAFARGVLHRGVDKSGVFSTVSWSIRVPIVAVGALNLSALHCIGHIRACPAVGSVNRKVYINVRLSSVHTYITRTRPMLYRGCAW